MRHGHHDRHRHWRVAPYVWRVHHSLRRRLFRSFGLAILLSAGFGWGIHALVEPARAAPWLALGGAALILWFASGGIAWAVTRPLVELVSVARDIGEGKLDRRMRLRPMGGHGGEVAILAEAVNTMAARIEQQLADQRELLAGVSHELRTPLGHLRVLIDTAREQLDHSAQPMLDELEREVVELDGLVDQLLVHSRLEFDRIERRELDPVALAVRALERVGEDASKLEVESEVEIVVGDPTLLGRALANLLSNARAHGRGLERLRVHDGDGGTLCLQGRARAGGSLGLGLSLVERIAKAHGGQVWARNRELGGACVGLSVALP
jgi:two-component system OmpR family sensor kinase